MWAGSILHVTDERYRVLLWGRGPRADAAAGLGRKLRQPGLVIVADRVLGRPVEFEELMPAADAMLVTAQGPVSPLPVGTAMAAGVPVISAETPLLRELGAAGRFALTPPADAPRLLAQSVLELEDDPELRDRLIAEGRAAARELFAPAAMTERYRALYASFGQFSPAARPQRAIAGSAFPSSPSSSLVETQT